MSLEIARRFEGLGHKLLENLRGDPRAAQTDLDLGGVQILGLCAVQSFHVDLEERVFLGCGLCLPELSAHVAGEVFVCWLPALIPMIAAFGIVKGASCRVLEDDAMQVLHDLRDVIHAAHESRHEGQVYCGPLTNRHGQGFRGCVYVVDAALLLDRAFRKNVRSLTEGLTVLFRLLQGAQKEVRRILGKGKLIRTVIDLPVLCCEGVIELAQFFLLLRDFGFLCVIVHFQIQQVTQAVPQLYHSFDPALRGRGQTC